MSLLFYRKNKMRSISYLWFWNVCWDDNRQWTILFSIMIPITWYFFVIEICRLLNNKKATSFSLLCSFLVTIFINEIILKPISYTGPYEDSCDITPVVPCTAISIAVTATTIYLLRFFLGTKDLPLLISWGVTTILELLAFPILKYMAWGFSFVSLIPGIFVGALWWYLFEHRRTIDAIEAFFTDIGIENDLNLGRSPQDLLPN